MGEEKGKGWLIARGMVVEIEEFVVF